jgi:hypothetical protein
MFQSVKHKEIKLLFVSTEKIILNYLGFGEDLLNATLKE